MTNPCSRRHSMTLRVGEKRGSHGVWLDPHAKKSRPHFSSRTSEPTRDPRGDPASSVTPWAVREVCHSRHAATQKCALVGVDTRRSCPRGRALGARIVSRSILLSNVTQGSGNGTNYPDPALAIDQESKLSCRFLAAIRPSIAGTPDALPPPCCPRGSGVSPANKLTQLRGHLSRRSPIQLKVRG